MKICLTPAKSGVNSVVTHAYLPALAACCGTLEYLTALYRGNIRGIGWQQIADFAVATYVSLISIEKPCEFFSKHFDIQWLIVELPVGSGWTEIPVGREHAD